MLHMYVYAGIRIVQSVAKLPSYVLATLGAGFCCCLLGGAISYKEEGGKDATMADRYVHVSTFGLE